MLATANLLRCPGMSEGMIRVASGANVKTTPTLLNPGTDKPPARAVRRRVLVVLEDGTYDAVVVDASDDDGAVMLDLAVLAGPHKGEVVTVRAEGLGRDSLDLLA